MRSVRYAWMVLLCCGCCLQAYADLKMRIVSHMSRQDSAGDGSEESREQVVFLSGDKVRIEPSEMKTIEILHCSAHDRKLYRVYMEGKEYLERKITLEKEQEGAVMRPGGEVESKTEDTGETREFFGHKARHLITHMKGTGKYGGESEWTQDGWYIEVHPPVNRCPVWNGRYLRAYIAGPTVNYGDSSVSFAHTGPIPDGMPVKLVQTYTIRTRTAKGTPIELRGTNMWEVLEFSETPLDPALFEPPRGFKKVRAFIDDRVRQQGATSPK